MKKYSLSLIVLLIMLFSGQLLSAESSLQATGTIRGGVYLDADSDGQCVGTDADKPIPGIDVAFKNGSQEITLYSGEDGTFGLPIAGEGLWQVTVQPDPGQWRTTSTSSQTVRVSPVTGLVQLGVNFCLQPVNSSTTTATMSHTAASDDIATASPSAQMTPEQIRSATSEELLTNPPEPIPDPDMDVEAATEVSLVSEAEWLAYLNLFREMGNLPHLQTEQPLSEGSQLHSRYMVVLDEPISHKEDPTKDLYTPPGDIAAQHSNIFATTQVEADYKWGINFWMSAPFHQVPLIDPELATVGYGHFNKDVGTFNMAAVLDIKSEDQIAEHDVEYPIYFPAQDSSTWIVRHSMYEWPDPLESCPGYVRPVGPSFVLQLGDGSKTPRVTSHRVIMGDIVLESCMFYESNYVNSDPYAQSTGRTILDERDAVVVMPRLPLEMGKTYTVEIIADGRPYIWSFNTGPVPTTD
ncbi:MAG: hypothetical protein IAF02_08330 [Anaerolineae bacterium]|nr:hypothetical protein [Anaerolineae bacterium]